MIGEKIGEKVFGEKIGLAMNEVAIYCRVSTEGQEQDGTSLQTQLEACRKYCQARRHEVGHELSEA